MDTKSQWTKYSGSPVLGEKYGTCFDISMAKDNGIYRMWFSWRPKKSIAVVESSDGINWSEPIICLSPADTGWEDDINRPGILKGTNGYHLWYTGQKNGHSAIGHAVSCDGITFKRTSHAPVLTAELEWEKVAVMCPHVIWDENTEIYRMWYSAGDQYEPDAIGYATSRDGDNWTKNPANPIFKADSGLEWERHKVTACQVIYMDGWYYMFYIGFYDENYAQIGVAKSADGISNWQRYRKNPIISPGENQDDWDHDATYKPFVIKEDGRWMLWYNGRRSDIEQIGLATLESDDLGF